MIQITLPSGFAPFQLEIPAGKARSTPGALHIRPSSTLVLTEDEFNFLCKEFPHLKSVYAPVDSNVTKPTTTVPANAPVEAVDGPAVLVPEATPVPVDPPVVDPPAPDEDDAKPRWRKKKP